MDGMDSLEQVASEFFELAKRQYFRAWSLPDAQDAVDEALYLIDKACSYYPCVEYINLHARIMLDEGEPETARELVEEALSRDPDNLDSLIIFGDVIAEDRDWFAAYEYLLERESREDAHENAFVQSVLAHYSFEGGDADRAKEHIENALAVDPDDEGYNCLAFGIYEVLEDHEACVNVLERLVGVVENAWPLYALGHHKVMLGRACSGITNMEEAVERDISLEEERGHLTDAYLEQGSEYREKLEALSSRLKERAQVIAEPISLEGVSDEQIWEGLGF